MKKHLGEISMEDLTNIVKEEYDRGKFEWRISKRVYDNQKNDLWDLFVMVLGNKCVRVASYNIKKERLIIPFPKMLIPNNSVLKEFIEICEKENKHYE